MHVVQITLKASAWEANCSCFDMCSNECKLLFDFPCPTIKFHDFPGLENEIREFHDFPGFQ